MKVIGFAEKYYTLWDVHSFKQDDHYGHSYTVTRYSFVKNISMSEDKVRTLYPGVTIDMELRGHSSFERRSSDNSSGNIDFDPTIFMFGKYKGTKFADCIDASYLAWYMDNISGDVKNNVKNRLVALGWIRVGDDVISPDEYASMSDVIDYVNNMKEKLANGENIVFTMEAAPKLTLDTDTYEYVNAYYNTNHCIFNFKPELFTVGTYQGRKYGMLAINGKGKRTKGKQIEVEVESYTVSEPCRWCPAGVIDINVKSFKILK